MNIERQLELCKIIERYNSIDISLVKENLRFYLKLHGLDRNFIATTLNINLDTASSYTNKSNKSRMDILNLLKLCNRLCINIEDLFIEHTEYCKRIAC